MANTHHKTSPKKPKLVRDSFTIPKAEFVLIEDMKDRAMALGTAVKKSELLRAGLKLLQGLNDQAYTAALAAVPTLKTGRPSSEAAAAEPVPPIEKTAVRQKAAAAPKTKPVVQEPVQTEKKKPGKAVATSPAATQAGVKVKVPAKPAAAPQDSRKAVANAPATAQETSGAAAVPAERPKRAPETATTV